MALQTVYDTLNAAASLVVISLTLSCILSAIELTPF